MSDFTNYVLENIPSFSKWETKSYGATAGAVALTVATITFNMGLFGFRSSLWLLLLIPVPLLFYYSFYCEKKDNEEKAMKKEDIAE